MSLSRPSVLSVDIGSSSVRAGLCDERGDHVAGTASRRTHRFAFADGGRVKADPDALVSLVAQCIDETLQGPAAAHRAVLVPARRCRRGPPGG